MGPGSQDGGRGGPSSSQRGQAGLKKRNVVLKNITTKSYICPITVLNRICGHDAVRGLTQGDGPEADTANDAD